MHLLPIVLSFLRSTQLARAHRQKATQPTRMRFCTQKQPNPTLSACGSYFCTQKAKALIAFAVADKDLVDGADEHLQLLHVTSLLQKELRAS